MSATAVPLRVGRLSWRVEVRTALVSVAGLGLLALLVALDLALGDFDVPLKSVVQALLGGGSPEYDFIVLELRLPQTTVAVLSGAALGLSGALTQTFARNPLASPDVLGVTEGAAVGAVGFLVLAGSTTPLGALGLSGSALVGGLGAAVLLYLLSWRRGIDGRRLVLIGIGLGATLSAATSWLLVRARLEDAGAATIWLTGSLTSRGWEHAVPLAYTLALLVPASLVLVHRLNAMQLGDDSARGLGVGLQGTQLQVLICAVGLAAMAVAAVGPLEFVAFVVPQIAIRLTGGSRPPVLASMIYGACLVVIADLVARVVLPFALPAGLVTAAIGAPYLLWLLIRTDRKATA